MNRAPAGTDISTVTECPCNRPVASKRRQSSHSELTTRPHDRMERRIKSHDDTASRRLCHQQEAYDDNYV